MINSALLFDWNVDAKQRCLPELHDVPYDTPPPSSAPSTSAAAASSGGASAGGASSSVVRRTSHHDLMDEPIYANSAAHPPITGNQSLGLYDGAMVRQWN